MIFQSVSPWVLTSINPNTDGTCSSAGRFMSSEERETAEVTGFNAENQHSCLWLQLKTQNSLMPHSYFPQTHTPKNSHSWVWLEGYKTCHPANSMLLFHSAKHHRCCLCSIWPGFLKPPERHFHRALKILRLKNLWKICYCFRSCDALYDKSES